MDEAKQQTVFDTDQQQVGEAYANALIGFGQANGNTESLLSQLSEVVGALGGVPKLGAMLQSPGIAVADKASLLDKAFGGKVDGKLMNFLKIVLDKGRFDCLGAIWSSAKKIFDEMSGRVQATITTAEPIEDSVRARVEKSLSDKLGKQIQLEALMDPSVIGGMVIRIGDTVYDGSVKSHLSRVRSNAIKNASDAIRGSLEKFMAS
jgi:F-type H+-transporting ATPase subunit delta